MLTSVTSEEIALFAARLAVTPVAGCAVDGIDRVRRFSELAGAVAAAQMREGVALADERIAEDTARGVVTHRRGAGAAGELGLARRCSPNQAGRWLASARVLQQDLPVTFARLSRGEIGERAAVAVARETGFLTPAHRRRVDAGLAPRLDGMGDRKVEGEARRAAQRLDPEGAAEKARNAISARRVTVRPAPDTMSWFTLLTSVQQGVACYASLRKHADGLIATGKQGRNRDGSLRTRDQVMADTAVERITGLAHAEDVPVEVLLVMTDRALFGQDPEPALVPGYGPISAPHARDLALRHRLDDAASDADSAGASPRDEAKRWIRRLYLTPDGSRLAAMDSTRRTFGENPRLFIKTRDEDTCRTPYCDAPVRHIDHVEDHARGGPTAVINGRGVCEACNHIKQSAGWRTTMARDGTVTTTTPAGHRYQSVEPRPPGGRPPTQRPKPIIEIDFEWLHAA